MDTLSRIFSYLRTVYPKVRWGRKSVSVQPNRPQGKRPPRLEVLEDRLTTNSFLALGMSLLGPYKLGDTIATDRLLQRRDLTASPDASSARQTDYQMDTAHIKAVSPNSEPASAGNQRAHFDHVMASSFLSADGALTPGQSFFSSQLGDPLADIASKAGTAASHMSAQPVGSSSNSGGAGAMSAAPAGKAGQAPAATAQATSATASSGASLSAATPAVAPTNTPISNVQPLVSSSAYYVSLTGSDSNPGTQAAPFKTIAKGVSVLAPGDTLDIMSGTYTARTDALVFPGGTASAPVTIQGAPGQTVILEPSTGQHVLYLGQSSEQYIAFNNLTLDGSHISLDAVKITYGTTSGAASHITIENSVIRNARGESGVLITGNTSDWADYNQILNCSIYDNGSSYLDHGIYCETSYNVFQGNTIYGNAGEGIQIYSSDGGSPLPCSYNTVDRNDIYGNSTSTSWDCGIGIYTGTNNLVYDNLVYKNPTGIAVDFEANNTYIYNNTIYDNVDDGGITIGENASASNTYIKNNIVYSDPNGDIVNFNGSNNVMTDNVTSHTNPMFVNAAAGNFQLQSGSPAIKAGANLYSQVAVDYTGTSRPSSGAFDVGAYQYAGSGGAGGGSATTYYVSLTGSDSNAGTLAAPFKTIATGVSMLKAGDTLDIMGGTYTQELDNIVLPGGTASAPVTIQADPGQTVILEPSSGQRVLMLDSSTEQFIVFNHLVIDASHVSSDAVKITWATGAGAASHITIENSEIRNSRQQGILITGTTNEWSNYNTILSDSIHNNGTSYLYHGIYIESQYNLVECCTLYSNAGEGVQIYSSDGGTNPSSYNVVARNTVYGNSTSSTWDAGIGVYIGTSNLVYDNLVYSNPTGIAVDFGATNSYIYNNTVYDNVNDGGITVGENASVKTTNIVNNIVYSNPNGNIVLFSGSGTTQNHNLTTNPLFVNAAGNNFELIAGSAAINAGVVLSEVPVDFLGLAHSSSTPYTVGAYSYPT